MSFEREQPKYVKGPNELHSLIIPEVPRPSYADEEDFTENLGRDKEANEYLLPEDMPDPAGFDPEILDMDQENAPDRGEWVPPLEQNPEESLINGIPISQYSDFELQGLLLAMDQRSPDENPVMNEKMALADEILKHMDRDLNTRTGKIHGKHSMGVGLMNDYHGSFRANRWANKDGRWRYHTDENRKTPLPNKVERATRGEIRNFLENGAS